MSKDEDTPKTAAETLESVLSFVRRSFMFWKRSTFVFLVVALLAIPGVFMKARIYRSETVVLYQENIKAAAITGGEGDNARRVGARLRETLLSRGSLEPIVNDVPRYAALADRRGMVDAVDELRGHIGFKAREGDAFEISYEAPIPAEAQEVTRRLGQSIVEQAANQRNEESKATRDLLDAQSKANKAKLDNANAAMSTFLKVHPEFARFLLPGAPGSLGPAGPATAPLPAVPKGVKDPVLFQMEAELASIQRQLNAKPGEPVAPAAPPPRDESDEVKAARRDLAEKRASGLTEQHPDVVAAKRRLDAAVAADSKRAAPQVPQPAAPRNAPTGADREALEVRANTLRRAIAAHKAGAPAPSAATAPTPSASAAASGSAKAASPDVPDVEFGRLKRDVEQLSDAQKQLDDKLFKAELTLKANSSDRNIQVKILDPAYLPVHPISKPRSTMLAMYLAAAFSMAALLALISARLDDRIYQRKDLEILDILPVVGVIPKGSGRRRRA